MSKGLVCENCGTNLEPEAIHGLCPVCLLRSALVSLPSTEIDSNSTPSIRYIGDYDIVDEIGCGAMGVVYKAVQRSLNRTVAVKIMISGRFSSENDIRRFRDEAAASATLEHPNIVGIYEIGEHEGLWYFSMEYVEGESLADLVAHGPLPQYKAAGYVKAIAEAVQDAHEQGILHRGT